MSLNRRDFILSFSSILAGCATSRWPPVLRTRNDRSLGVLVTSYSEGNTTRLKQNNGILIMDLDHNTFDTVKTAAPIHQVIQSPVDADIGFGIQRMGGYICKVNFKKKQMIQERHLETKNLFYGHLDITKDGKNIFATATGEYYDQKMVDSEFEIIDSSEEEKKSRIAPREDGTVLRLNPENLALDSRFQLSTEGLGHDCQLLPDQKTMIVTAGNRLLFLDTESEKIGKTLSLHEEKNRKLFHFAPLRSGDIFIASYIMSGRQRTLGKIVLYEAKEGGFRIIQQQPEFPELSGELFSVCMSPTAHVAAVAAPWTNAVGFFDINRRMFTSSFRTRNPTAISLTLKSEYFVVIGLEGLHFIDVNSCQEIKPMAGQFSSSFSQLLRHRRLPTRFYHSLVLARH